MCIIRISHRRYFIGSFYVTARILLGSEYFKVSKSFYLTSRSSLIHYIIISHIEIFSKSVSFAYPNSSYIYSFLTRLGMAVFSKL